MHYILLLGSDASGKDYLANVIKTKDSPRQLQYVQGSVHSREKPPQPEATRKHGLRIRGEKIALWWALRWKYSVLHLALLLTYIDFLLPRFKHTRTKVVIGHYGLRIAAFCLGHIFKNPNKLGESLYFDLLFKGLGRLLIKHLQGRAYYLYIDQGTRTERIEQRRRNRQEDPFDRYMSEHLHVSQAIDAMYTYIANKYFQAKTLRGNSPYRVRIKNRDVLISQDTA